MKHRCVSTFPGYFPTPSKVASPFSNSVQSLPAADKPQGPLPRLFEKLAKLQALITSVDFQCSILHHADLLPLRTVLYRLGMMLQSRKCQKTPLQKLTRSASTVSILLFILDIVFGILEHPELNPVSRHGELRRIQQRLISQRLDQEGSLEKAWQVLMVGDEQPSLQLHSRAWSVAETTNILKHLSLTTLDSLSKMLMGFLLPGICGEVGEYGFEKFYVKYTSN